MPRISLFFFLSLAGAFATALTIVFPVGGERTPAAEAAPACPITVRVAFGPNVDTPLPGQLETAFENAWAPGTDLMPYSVNSLAGINTALSAHNAEVALLTTPFVYPTEWPAQTSQWEVAAGLWVAVLNSTAVTRVNNSAQVRADDFVNWLRSPAGSAYLSSLGHVPVWDPNPWGPPIPDWDANQDWQTSLGDLGVVSSKWSQRSACRGWISADINNSGNVSLADIGGVTSHWGQPGAQCFQCVTTNWWKNVGDAYSYDNGCADDNAAIDPITTILLSTEGSTEAARQQIQDDFTAIDLDNGNNGGLNPAITFQHFRENGPCVEGEITQATENQWCTDYLGHLFACAEEQWHARCNVVDNSAKYGFWATCTPHWDEVTGDNDCSVFHQSHYVPAVWDDPALGNEAIWGDYDGSGFDAARDWLWVELVQNEGHTFIGWMNYGNTRPMQQCNGEWTHADGKVNIIRLD